MFVWRWDLCRCNVEKYSQNDEMIPQMGTSAQSACEWVPQRQNRRAGGARGEWRLASPFSPTHPLRDEGMSSFMVMSLRARPSRRGARVAVGMAHDIMRILWIAAEAGG